MFRMLVLLFRILSGIFPRTGPFQSPYPIRMFKTTCNTPGVAMAGTHLGTQDYDHMWKNLRSKSIRGFGN
jgi:hypothetical protein